MIESDFHWLVGLLEGEGSFYVKVDKGYKYPAIALNMTDRDVVDRAAALMGATVFRLKHGKNKDSFQCRVQGGRALLLFGKLQPHMGKRRQRQIAQTLDTVGIGYVLKMDTLKRS